MKPPDPRLAKIERLLFEAGRLLAEMKAGVPAPRRPRRKRHQFRKSQILEALAEGVRTNAPLEERDPRLPDRSILGRMRRADPKFSAAVSEALAAGVKARLPTRSRKAVEGASERARRLPGQGYDWNLIAQKIEAGAVIGPNSSNRQGLPSHSLIMARRKADPAFAARVHRVLENRFGPNVRMAFNHDTILERIRRGAVIKACPPEPGMPNKARLDRERDENDEFDHAVCEAIKEARRRRMNRDHLAKLPSTAAWDAAQRAVPRHIPEPVRSDICGEVSLLIFEGIVKVEADLAAVWKGVPHEAEP